MIRSLTRSWSCSNEILRETCIAKIQQKTREREISFSSHRRKRKVTRELTHRLVENATLPLVPPLLFIFPLLLSLFKRSTRTGAGLLILRLLDSDLIGVGDEGKDLSPSEKTDWSLIPSSSPALLSLSLSLEWLKAEVKLKTFSSSCQLNFGFGESKNRLEGDRKDRRKKRTVSSFCLVIDLKNLEYERVKTEIGLDCDRNKKVVLNGKCLMRVRFQLEEVWFYQV